MFAFQAVGMTIFNSLLAWLIWADREHVNSIVAVLLALAVAFLLAYFLIRRHFKVVTPPVVTDLHYVNMAAVVIYIGFSFCGWPGATRPVATVLLATATAAWWVVRIVCYVDGQ